VVSKAEYIGNELRQTLLIYHIARIRDVMICGGKDVDPIMW
jgi:hypothetical protein